MSDEELHRLGQVMSEQDESIDPRLERYAFGTLDDEELAALTEDAAQNPALAEAMMLHAPLSGGTRATIAASVARPAPPPARSARRWWLGAGVVAAAAAAVLFARVGLEPLPSYTLVAEGGDQIWRSEGSALGALRPDAELTFIARPQRSVEGPVVGAIWRTSPPPVVRLEHDFDVSEDGAIRWQGPASDFVMKHRGPSSFVVMVGRAGTLPATPPSAGAGETDVLRVTVVVEE